MARIFITGSADGLGSLAAQQLIADGHQVVLHARTDERGKTALEQAPGAEKVLIADLTKLDEVKDLAAQVNALGHFDAVIHNAGIYDAPAQQIFTVNSLAPYVLTALIDRPERLIYLSSGMHRSGRAVVENLEQDTTYSDSKLQIVWLVKAVARHWPEVYANAVDPGWVPTKMGGAAATDSLEAGYVTQVWLATSTDSAAKVSGKYFFHQQPQSAAEATDDTTLQDQYIAACEQLSGVKLS